MSPKGNKTDRRGHRAPVGGENSKGTVQMTVRLSVETFEKVKKKMDKLKMDFAGYVRSLVEKDLNK